MASHLNKMIKKDAIFEKSTFKNHAGYRGPILGPYRPKLLKQVAKAPLLNARQCVALHR